MDTLINLSIKSSYVNSSYQPKIKNIVFNLNDFYKLYSTNPIFEFREYDKVEVTFSCIDKDVLIKLESYYEQGLNESTIDDSKWELCDVDETIRILKPGESIILSPGGDAEDMLVPGEYSIQICRENDHFEGFFNIIPNSVDWQAMTKIKDYLESTVKGLSYNIYLQKKSTKQGTSNLYPNIESYRYLYGVQEQLLNYIKCVIDNPIMDIKKEYVTRGYSKRQDNKSQRWLSKKGIRYNTNILAPSLFCEKHSYYTDKITENIILKRILNYMQNVLIEAEYEYIKLLNSINKHKQELEDKINSKNKVYVEASKLANTNNVNKIRRFKINNLIKERDSYKDKETITKNHLNNLYKLKGKLNYYINETWIKEINLKYNTSDVTTRILKNYHYNEIYSIYNKLRNSNISGGFDVAFPHKKTSRLFEIYSFLITKDIFEELGFEWIDGWLKSREMDEVFNGDLVAGDSIIMKKEDYTLVIAYDLYIGIPDELKEVTISQPSTKPDNHHRRPDILISLYEGTKLLGCEVIEVKYRKKLNIYNDKGIDTDVCKQLSSYTGFDYYDANRGRVIREKPVYKVLALYPKQDDLGQFKHSIYDIEFIPIMPNREYGDKYYGYENLKKELTYFLEEFIQNDICL